MVHGPLQRVVSGHASQGRCYPLVLSRTAAPLTRHRSASPAPSWSKFRRRNQSFLRRVLPRQSPQRGLSALSRRSALLDRESSVACHIRIPERTSCPLTYLLSG